MLSVVSTTPAINFSPAMNCIDDRGLFYLQIGTNWWYLRPPKSDTAANGVTGTAMKSCIHRPPHILIRDPWGSQNYFKPKRRYLVLAAPGASGCLWMQLFMAVPMTPSVAVSHFGGWRYSITDLSPSTFSYPWLLPTSMASLLLPPAINLSPCRCHRIAGVIVTDDNSSPVSTIYRRSQKIPDKD